MIQRSGLALSPPRRPGARRPGGRYLIAPSMELVTSEAVVRLTAFAISLALLAVVEAVVPRRRRTIARQHRWMGNLGLVVVDTILLRALVFLSATAMAARWRKREAGVCSRRSAFCRLG